MFLLGCNQLVQSKGDISEKLLIRTKVVRHIGILLVQRLLAIKILASSFILKQVKERKYLYLTHDTLGCMPYYVS